MIPKVLILEDDFNLNRLIQKGFRTANFDIVAAYTLAEAIQALEKETVEFIVLDLGLPDGNGWEIVEAVRAAQLDYPTPKIIIATGRDLSEIPPDYAKAYPILQKPISMRELIRLTLDLRYKKTP